jgi:ABC-type transport system involved in multi-copper enzyme maturation permease subunit
MGRLNRIVAVSANTFRETVRERVLYNLVFFALLMTLSGLLLAQLSIRQDQKIIKDLGLAAMDLFGTLIAVFIGVGLVSKEIERRSLYPLLAKPLSRDELILGKFCGLSFTVLVNVACMTAGLWLTLYATSGRLELGLLRAIYPIFLGLLLVVALALLFSTLTNGPVAAICTVSVVLAGRFSDVIRNMQEVVPAAPAWVTRALVLVLPNFQNFDLKDRVVYGDPVGASALLFITLYALGYILLALGAAVFAFRAREFQ